MQRIMIQLEVPTTIPAGDLMEQVADVLMEELGATIISSMRVVSEKETLLLP